MLKQSNMKVVWKYCIVFVSLIVAYLLFGIVSNLLPNQPIEHNVKKTLERGDLADDFSYAFVSTTKLYTDNYTDALILNQACNGGSDSLFTSVLLVPRLVDSVSECTSLRHAMARDTVLSTEYYARYWHGSTFAMRWLLQITNYITLRLLFYLISSLLLMWVVMALYRRLNAMVAGSYLLSLLLVNVFIMQFSIQFMPVLLLTLAATLWVVYRVRTAPQMMMLMFVIGSMTAYFDLLTCPIVTWGMPICIYLLMNEGEELRRRVGSLFAASVMWAVGYGATWGSKWLITSLVTPVNVLKDAYYRIVLRAGDDFYFTRWEALTNNLDMVVWPWVCAVLLILVALMLFRFRRKGLPTALLCLLLAVPPLLWYLAAANHSYLHAWFTYRNMAVVLFAIFSAMGSLVDLRREGSGD